MTRTGLFQLSYGQTSAVFLTYLICSTGIAVYGLNNFQSSIALPLLEYSGCIGFILSGYGFTRIGKFLSNHDDRASLTGPEHIVILSYAIACMMATMSAGMLYAILSGLMGR